MKKFKLPNGKGFESNYPISRMPIVIGEIPQSEFDKENPIPQEYIEHVKEEFNGAKIYYRHVSIYNEETSKLEFIVRYSILAISDEFPKFRTLSYLEWDRHFGDPSIERMVELTFACEDASCVQYIKKSIVNVNLVDLIESCLDDLHDSFVSGYEDDECDYYDMMMYDEAGWMTPICINDRDDFEKFLVGIRFVEEVK